MFQTLLFSLREKKSGVDWELMHIQKLDRKAGAVWISSAEREQMATKPRTLAQFLDELNTAVLPVATVCFAMHEQLSGSDVAAAAWAALHKIDGVRDALRSEIKAQAAPAPAPDLLRWDGSVSKHDRT